MILLEQIGLAGLRRLLEEQRSEDAMGFDVAEVPEATGQLATMIRAGSHLTRKASARARLLVDAQRHASLIHAHVCRYYDTPTIRNEILRHVDVLKNLQRKVTDRVAIAYSRPAARALRDADKDQEKKFLAAYKAARTDTLAEKWNRYAFFLSVVHVIPRYENGQLRWVTVLPDRADVLFDPEGEEDPSILVYETKSHGAMLVAVDSERWWWVAKDWTLIHEEQHHMGMRPWVPFRWEEPPEDDYWNRGAGQDLLDATLELARVYAHSRWIRKNWSKKLATLHTGANVHIPENQNLGANQPVKGEGDGAFNLEIHDTIVGMTEFQAEMVEIDDSVREAYGLPTSKDKRTNLDEHEALVKLRNKQIKGFDYCEMELAVRVAVLLRYHGAMSLTEEDVRASFRCRHASMNFLEHPKDRVETLEAQMRVGHRNPYDEYMLENPGATFEEAIEEVDRNVELRARLLKKFVNENIPMDPADDLKSPAQLNGKRGGMKSGEVRNETEETEDEEQADAA